MASPAPGYTINIIFGIFAVLLGTLSVVVAVATWMSGHHLSSNGQTKRILTGVEQSAGG